MKLDISTVVEGLSAQEKKVLLALQQLEGKASVADVGRRAGLDQATVMRAVLTLSEHGLIEVFEKKISKAILTPEGWGYARDGLPERRMLVALASCGSEVADEIAARAALKEDQKQIALTWLKRKGWAEFLRREEKTLLSITEGGGAALSQKTPDETLLELLSAQERNVDELPADMKEPLRTLVGRKLVRLEEETQRELKLTTIGIQALELGIEPTEEVSELTHGLLMSGRWQEVKLRRYDVVAPGAPIYPGKIHPQQQVIDELREILLEMGFVEIRGKIVESEFWNFDALFQAQDHPAREIHDSLSLSKPERTKLPQLVLVKRVAAAHEHGVAGSKGWGYKFNTDISRRPVLCSQTTAATVRYLASHPEPPVKVFCIDRVYRHEKIDYKHLAEFYQAEGIVMDPGLTLRDMLGYLKQIVVKLGLPKIRFRPGYFPYTEPSVEADVYFPEKREWLEVLGAGMFRPELLRPLGVRHPVLAWGIGFSRLAMIKLGIDDIRDLYRNDIEWLQKRRMI
ncbi:MAG: phenylalanine--tRNA ligase subunit alpha [Candidatus Hodarchaeaceae archaeon]|nr:phenylalanine--tRNA ligase subunit alpha [Candidatus Hodarchaeaceae archaeon]